MEEKNASAIITDDEFVMLLQAARQKQPQAMLRIIELFRDDIEKVSQMIRIPKEDAVSHIITELLDYVQTDSIESPDPGICEDRSNGSIPSNMHSNME